MGKRFSGDEKQYAKMTKAVAGVLARAVKARHSNLLNRARAALCSESWSQLAPVLLSSFSSTSAASSSSSSAYLFFDAQVHDVCVTGPWHSPFLDEHAIAKADSRLQQQQQQQPDDDEENEELKSSHVEEGDELVYEKDGRGNNNNGSSSNLTSSNNNGNNSNASEVKLLSCPVGRMLISAIQEDALLLEALPEAAAAALLRGLSTIWRYLVFSVWSFFVEGSSVSVSDSLSRLLSHARASLIVSEGSLSLSSSSGPIGMGAELREMFGSSANLPTPQQRRADEDLSVASASLSSSCDVTSAAGGFGVSARRAAAETVLAVAAALTKLHKTQQQSVQQQSLQQQLRKDEEEISLSAELRDVLLERCAAAVVQQAEVVRAMTATGWCAGEDHDGRYVADLSRRMRLFQKRKKKKEEEEEEEKKKQNVFCFR